MSDESHKICALEQEIAVLREQAKGAAMALVLAKDLAAADRKASISLLIGAIGWLFALAALGITLLRS